MNAPVQAAPVAADEPLSEGLRSILDDVAAAPTYTDEVMACERCVFCDEKPRNGHHSNCAVPSAIAILASSDLSAAPVAAPVAQGDVAGWISVDERLPTVPGAYLLWLRKGSHGLVTDRALEGQYKQLNSGWAVRDMQVAVDVTGDVTHWMPMPAAPIAKATGSAA